MDRPDTELTERVAQIRLLALDVDGVLTDGRLFFDDRGRELKAFHTRDGMGIKALHRSGIEIALITGRQSTIVQDRATQLGIVHVYQGQDDKLAALEDLLSKTGLSEDRVCYAGDDWVDLPVLKRVGFAVAVADAEPEVKQCAHWITSSGGGRGAVREICNFILSVQGVHDAAVESVAGP